MLQKANGTKCAQLKCFLKKPLLFLQSHQLYQYIVHECDEFSQILILLEPLIFSLLIEINSNIKGNQK